MKERYTLVVVDMQRDFIEDYMRGHSGNYERFADALEGCVERVKRAQKENMPILYLYYDGNGPFHHVLRDLYNEYNPRRRARGWKVHDDGSDIVVSTIRNRRWPKHTVYTGINASACVRQTIIGNTQFETYRQGDISVVANAIANPVEFDLNYGSGNDDDNLKNDFLYEASNVGIRVLYD